MKKIIITLGLIFSLGTANEANFNNFMLEVEANSAIADRCFEELAISGNTDDKYCSLFMNKIGGNITVYETFLSKDYSAYSHLIKDGFWDQGDWSTIRYKVKKMVFLGINIPNLK